MKYFKPELLAKCRSSNPDIAETAACKWQKNAEAYRKHLREIRDLLPGSVRSLMRSVTLHDAYLVTVNLAQRRERIQYFLSFELAGGDGHAGVQLCYDRVMSIVAEDHDPKAGRDINLFVLYDEFDLLNDGSLTHSILMTGGIETRIKFARLIVTHFTHVVAAGRGQLGMKKELVEMAAS